MMPTEEQLVCFAQEIAEAHSWYKHLSLLRGAEFSVGTSPYAGMYLQRTGFRPFTAEFQRLHYGWKTTDEYVRRFGQLVFGSRKSPDEPFIADGDVTVGEFDHQPTFRLFPYVNGDLTDVWSVHEEDFIAIKQGHPHPERDAILELAATASNCEKLWQRLSDSERDLFGKQPPASALAQEHQAADNRKGELLARLAAAERDKITKALSFAFRA